MLYIDGDWGRLCDGKDNVMCGKWGGIICIELKV